MVIKPMFATRRFYYNSNNSNNNVSVQYNGGLLPDIILSTRCSYIGNPFDTMKRFCLYSQCSHLNLQTLFPLEVDAQKV